MCVFFFREPFIFNGNCVPVFPMFVFERVITPFDPSNIGTRVPMFDSPRKIFSLSKDFLVAKTTTKKIFAQITDENHLSSAQAIVIMTERRRRK